MNLQIVSGRPTVLPTAIPSRAAEDIQAATAMALGYATERRKEKQAAAEAQANRENAMKIVEVQDTGATTRTTMTEAGSDRRQAADIGSRREEGEAERRSRAALQAKDLSFRGKQASQDRAVQRYGIDTGAATSRYSADAGVRSSSISAGASIRSAEIGAASHRAELEARANGTYFGPGGHGGAGGMSLQPDDVFLSPGNMVTLYGQAGDVANPDSLVGARADTIQSRVRRQFNGGNPLAAPPAPPAAGRVLGVPFGKPNPLATPPGADSRQPVDAHQQQYLLTPRAQGGAGLTQEQFDARYRVRQ